MDQRIALGRAIRRARLDAGFTQEELGFEAGVERSYVSAVELATKDPSFTTIFKIAFALKITLPKLFELFEEELDSKLKQPKRRRGRPKAAD